MIKGIDTNKTITAAAAREIAAAGYQFVGRYLCPRSWPKALKAEEVRVITEAGMRVLCVWETSAGRAKSGTTGGAYDGAQARQHAQDIGMPAGGCIYFAVDFGASAGDYPAIAAYLTAARKALGGAYKIGVYGSYNVVEEMHRRGLCDCYWQCVAWSGGKKSKYRNIYQAQWGQTVAGLGVDINECDDMDAAGLWPLNEKTPEPQAPEKEDEDMDISKLTDKECYELVERANEYAKTLGPADWSAEDRAWAERNGILQGDEHGNKMYAVPTTREMMVAFLHRLAKVIGNRIAE